MGAVTVCILVFCNPAPSLVHVRGVVGALQLLKYITLWRSGFAFKQTLRFPDCPGLAAASKDFPM